MSENEQQAFNTLYGNYTDLDNNAIADNGAKEMAEVLARNCCLVVHGMQMKEI